MMKNGNLIILILLLFIVWHPVSRLTRSVQALDTFNAVSLGGIKNIDSTNVTQNNKREKIYAVYYGDINKNGIIETKDAILTLRYIVGIEELLPEQIKRAKVSLDEDDVSIQDVILILRFIVGLIEVFPIESESGDIMLELVPGEYRAQYKEDNQYDTPILIDSFAEWQDFLDSHPEAFPTEDVLQQDYDEIYFEDKIIYAYVKKEHSGSIRLKVYKAEKADDILKLFVIRNVPEVGSADMATRICLFGIKRADILNINTIEVVMLE